MTQTPTKTGHRPGEVPVFRKDDLEWLEPRLKLYRAKTYTPMVRITGPFQVETKEGVLTCPDGYLAFDQQGWPYPISLTDHKLSYEEVKD